MCRMHDLCELVYFQVIMIYMFLYWKWQPIFIESYLLPIEALDSHIFLSDHFQVKGKVQTLEIARLNYMLSYEYYLFFVLCYVIHMHVVLQRLLEHMAYYMYENKLV